MKTKGKKMLYLCNYIKAELPDDIINSTECRNCGYQCDTPYCGMCGDEMENEKSPFDWVHEFYLSSNIKTIDLYDYHDEDNDFREGEFIVYDTDNAIDVENTHLFLTESEIGNAIQSMREEIPTFIAQNQHLINRIKKYCINYRIETGFIAHEI